MKTGFALAAFSTLFASAAGAAPDPAPIAVRAARLLDVLSGPCVERPVVVMKAGEVVRPIAPVS